MEWLIGIVLAALLYATRRRVERAEKRLVEQGRALDLLQVELAQLRVARVESLPRLEAAAPEPAPATEALEAPEPELPPSAADPVAPEPTVPEPIAAPLPLAPPRPDPILIAVAAVREWLFGGNTVVRVGILVLLVGVTLLLRWAADNALFPIELRLAGTALAALGLTAFGLRERRTRPGFGLTLQGGGIAAQYLVVCFAYRSYALLPGGLAFALLIVLSLVSGVLSVRQDSKALIFIAQAFGFAAPIFASSGQGNHVALFAYYLVLNTLVFAVAFFKAWRALNVLGFVFTFGIATAWGALHYEPALFASTEPFLLAFFVLYVAIPVLFALRHPSTPGGWVDGSLIFGVPLSTLALQWSLVHDTPFGMAFSALGLGAVYLGLALVIRRRAPERLSAIAEAFLPIGIGFATLAVPYGFDSQQLTGATWALEGAGLYWVGVRQQRWLSRVAGVALQVLAGVAASLAAAHASAVVAGIAIGSSSLFIAYYGYHCRSQLRSSQWRGVQALIAWGVLFWLRAGFAQLDVSVPVFYAPGAQLAFLGSSALALSYAAERKRWWPGQLPGLLLWPALLIYLGEYAFDLVDQPLSHGGWFGWPLMAAAMWLVLRRFVDKTPRLWPAHPAAVWLWLWWLALVCEGGVRRLGLDESYGIAAANLAIAGVGLAIVKQSRGSGWPSGRRARTYLRVVMAGLVTLNTWRSLVANVSLPVDTAPLPYLPMLNALDLSTAIGFATALVWLRRMDTLFSAATAQRWLSALCVAAFVWWNALLARTVHHYAHVPFELERLFDSSDLQLACSLSWTTIALTVMWIAHRRGVRGAWIAAASLLALVVAKLFLLDLSQLSTGAKIASFLGVGILLLLIGYVAPAPPRSKPAPPPPAAPESVGAES